MRSVRAKKHLGQHFLTDKNIAKKITDLINTDSKHIVEIGPGMGVLTKNLIQKNIPLTIIEIDSESVNYLRIKFPELNQNIIENDFLKTNIKKDLPSSFSLIGNFPYNISSQILFKVFENKNQVKEVIGMFQKEVAERIITKKGKKKGILSILMQAFFDVEYCFTVDEHVFNPPPKIKSGVIKLVRNKRLNIECSENLFINIVKTSFNQRRKTLRNALKSFSLESKLANTVLLKKRAEELSVEDFIKITLACQKEKK